MKKKRRNRLPAIMLVVVLVVGAICLFPYASEFVDTSSSYGEEVIIKIPEGASTENIGEILKENGLIKSVNIFKVRAYLDENGSKLNYGTFALYKGMCIPDIMDTLASNYSYKDTVTLTIPEGFSIEQIAKRCEEIGLCSESEFIAEVKVFKHDYPVNEGVKFSLQGYLYPETYEFFTDATAKDIIIKLVRQYDKVKDGIKKSDIKVDRSWKDIMIIASLIEREAMLDSEMSKIAGVIYNRLDKGMRLQIDAAVQYAVSDGFYDVDRIKYSDLEIDSPYNTYKVDSLPIGPICNPGIDAILAACNPDKHDYLYYHTDTEKNDGSHIFTKTYNEHLSSQ